MTIPSTPFRKDHTGNDVATSFLYNWKIDAKTELKVIRQTIATGVESTLTVDVDYTVTGVGNAGGGNVVFGSPLASTYKITILPNFAYEQDTDFTNQNSVKPEVAEEMADKLSRQIKQVVEQVGRAVKLPETSTDTPANYINDMNTILAAAQTAQAGAETAETNAETAQAAAETAQAGAETAERNAGTSETAAAGSASSASTSATAAAASATSASGSASAASTSASNAATSETAAASSASTASTAATTATTKASEASASAAAASTSETNAAASESAAATSETNAAASEDLAMRYAEEAEDVQVETGTYSAKHWAAKAQDFASGTASNISVTPAGNIASTNVQDALEELDSEKLAGSEASQSELESGADGKFPDAATIRAAFGFSEFFESAEITITTNSQASVAHGLSSTPVLWTMVLRCKTSEYGYAVGDEIQIFTSNTTTGSNRLGTVIVNSTTIYIATNDEPQIPNKAGNGINNLNYSNWKAIVRAWG